MPVPLPSSDGRRPRQEAASPSASSSVPQGVAQPPVTPTTPVTPSVPIRHRVAAVRRRFW